MPTIDIHTHMVSRSWIDVVATLGRDRFTVEEGPAGPMIFESFGVNLVTNPRMFDYASRIAMMDQNGIDISVVSLTSPNVYFGDEAASTTAARTINDAMAAAQRTYPERIRFFASLPMEFPDAAFAELERAYGLGAAGLMVLCNIRGRELNAPQFAPVWSEIDRRGLTVFLHPTNPPGVTEMNVMPVRASIGFTYDTTLALSKMIVDGFFDRYPNITFIMPHAGGTLPFLAGRMDLFEGVRPAADRKIAKLPSDYLRHFRYDSVLYDRRALDLLADLAGPERILFGTDYPHPTNVPRILELVDALGPDAAARIRGTNAAALLNL